MKNTQAWGWLAAGVLALGLNGIYHDGGAAWAHRALNMVVNRITERTGPMLALASGHAEWFLARTRNAVVRQEASSCRLTTAMARVQSRMARAQSEYSRFEEMSARQEAAQARMQAVQARMEANRERIEFQLQRIRFSPVAFNTLTVPAACPRVRVNIPRMNVPRVGIPRMPVVRIPDVRVDVLGAGPV